MKKITKSLYVISNLLLASFATLANAAFEELGTGARVPGMGNAFVAVADDVHSLHYNPAGLGTLGRPQLSLSYSRLLIGLSDNSNLGASFFGYAQPLRQGKWGGLAFGWQQLKLEDLYQERTFSLAYGKQAWSGSLGRLYLGATLKQLYRGVGDLPETNNAANRLVSTGRPDPVLVNHRSRSALDVDLGALAALNRRFSVGLALVHVNRPDVALDPADEDKLPLGLRTGAAYRGRGLTVTSQLDVRRGATGSMDRIMTVGGERWISTDRGSQLGLRGSMGLGSREFRQLTAGLSYRFNRMQLDYGFIMGLGTVSSVAGTHRLAFTVNFGGERDEERIVKDLAEVSAEKSREQRASSAIEGLRSLEVEDRLMARLIQAHIELGHYDKAYRYLAELPDAHDAALAALKGKLKIIAAHVPELEGTGTRSEKELSEGVWQHLAGNSEGLNRIALAAGLNPQDKRVTGMLAELESFSSVRATPQLLELSDRLQKAQALRDQGDLQRALEAYDGALALDPQNPTALIQLGKIHYLQGNVNQAMLYWIRAILVEQDPKSRRELQEAVYGLGLMSQKVAPAEVALSTAPVAVPAPSEAQGQPSAAPRVSTAAAKGAGMQCTVGETGDTLQVACSGQGAQEASKPPRPAVQGDAQCTVVEVDGALRVQCSEGGTRARKTQEASPEQKAFQADWKAYQKLKARKAPEWKRLSALGELVKRYLNKGVDLSLVRQELVGLGVPTEKPKLTSADAAEINALYENGVSLYASDKTEQAVAIFTEILKRDPAHAGARLALDRIEREVGRRKKAQ